MRYFQFLGEHNPDRHDKVSTFNETLGFPTLEVNPATRSHPPKVHQATMLRGAVLRLGALLSEVWLRWRRPKQQRALAVGRLAREGGACGQHGPASANRRMSGWP